MTENLMLSIAAIGILGSMAQWMAWWLKLPSILLLLLLWLYHVLIGSWHLASTLGHTVAKLRAQRQHRSPLLLRLVNL